MSRKGVQVDPRKYEEYRGLCFYNGEFSLVVDVWLNRVDEDSSGLNFEEWDPSVDADTSQSPVVMIVNSNQLCVIDFDLREVIITSLCTQTQLMTNQRCTQLNSKSSGEVL